MLEGTAQRLFVDYATNCCKHARPFDGMAEVLSALRERGKRLGIVTNGESVFQRQHIDSLALGRLVDEVLVSEGRSQECPVVFQVGAEAVAIVRHNRIADTRTLSYRASP